MLSFINITGYYQDGEDQENVNNGNIDDNEDVFKVPLLPPEPIGNGIKKKKLKSKGKKNILL